MSIIAALHWATCSCRAELSRSTSKIHNKDGYRLKTFRPRRPSRSKRHESIYTHPCCIFWSFDPLLFMHILMQQCMSLYGIIVHVYIYSHACKLTIIIQHSSNKSKDASHIHKHSYTCIRRYETLINFDWTLLANHDHEVRSMNHHYRLTVMNLWDVTTSKQSGHA